jgi:rhodanese-related sulfurtransferase
MEKRLRNISIVSMCFGVIASIAAAEYLMITAEELQERLTGSKKVVLIDVRSHEEYGEGHIPGAINIPEERISIDRARLPKDKSTAIIFYCRGVG